MDRFVERCAGLDVHKASVKACIRIPDGHGGRRSETRTFRTTTAGLVLLGDWLASHHVQVVGMESTGVFAQVTVPPNLALQAGGRGFESHHLHSAGLAANVGRDRLRPSRRYATAPWSTSSHSRSNCVTTPTADVRGSP
jgi:hypothetical protein